MFTFGSNERGTWNKNNITGEIIQTFSINTKQNITTLGDYPISFTKIPILAYGNNSFDGRVEVCRPDQYYPLTKYLVKTNGNYDATISIIAIGY